MRVLPALLLLFALPLAGCLQPAQGDGSPPDQARQGLTPGTGMDIPADPRSVPPLEPIPETHQNDPHETDATPLPSSTLPPEEEVQVAWTLDQRLGAWRFRFSTDDLAGHPGEQVPFLLEVLPEPGASEGRLLGGPWVRLEGAWHGTMLNLTSQPLRVRGWALAGAQDEVTFEVIQRRSDGDHGLGRLQGPPVRVVESSTAQRLEMVPDVVGGDDASLEAGLTLAPEEGRLVATYSVGASCATATRAHGPFELWRIAGDVVLVGFVSTGAGDVCTGLTAPFVRASLEGVPPDPVKARVFEGFRCFCLPVPSWRTYEAETDLA